MAVPRRVGAESSETRTRLLAVAERLMLEEGYAAVTARRVGSKAGVAPGLLYYYFPTLDDLFVAILRQRADEVLEHQAGLLASEAPVRALWEFSTSPYAGTFTSEFMALANHREAVRREVVAYHRRYLEVQHEALSAAQRDGRLDLGDVPLRGLLVLALHLASGLLTDRALRFTWGHDEAFALVERYLGMAEDETRRSAGPGDRLGHGERSVDRPDPEDAAPAGASDQQASDQAPSSTAFRRGSR
jgi:TetR/AcrR family transcriptional regulator